MTGKINQAFRRLLVKKFLEDTDIESVYLVFSLDESRELADTLDNATATIDSVHLDNSDVTAKYAVRLDTSNRLKFAKEKEEGDTGTEVDINARTYILSDSYTSDKFWTDVYFNAPITGSSAEFNVVSVVINVDETDAELLYNYSFTDALFTDAEIVMQTRPAKKVFNDIENNEFPGLIKF